MKSIINLLGFYSNGGTTKENPEALENSDGFGHYIYMDENMNVLDECFGRSNKKSFVLAVKTRNIRSKEYITYRNDGSVDFMVKFTNTGHSIVGSYFPSE